MPPTQQQLHPQKALAAGPSLEFPSLLPYDPQRSSSRAQGTCFQSNAAKSRRGMFNTDLAEGGKLAVLRKDNSILTGAVAACQRTPGSTVAFSKI